MLVDQFGDTYYKVALHQHTTRSDGKIPPEAVAARYKAAGFDAIALTDHWIYADDREIDGLLIIPGCEYNLGTNDSIQDGVMHIVGVGMEKDPRITRKCLPRQAVIDGINAAGGIALLAHPAWSLNTPDDLAALHGFSAVEIYNSVSDTHNNFQRADSSYFIDLCANRGMFLPLIATDDAHYYDGDECVSWTMVRARELSVSAILDGIRAGDCYATQGPWLSVKRKEKDLIIHCSPCSTIATLSNLSCTKGRTTRGEGLTAATYTPAASEQWVRVIVVDAEGRQAWSNIIKL